MNQAKGPAAGDSYDRGAAGRQNDGSAPPMAAEQRDVGRRRLPTSRASKKARLSAIFLQRELMFRPRPELPSQAIRFHWQGPRPLQATPKWVCQRPYPLQRNPRERPAPEARLGAALSADLKPESRFYNSVYSIFIFSPFRWAGSVAGRVAECRLSIPPAKFRWRNADQLLKNARKVVGV